jgi:hypothetical protein
MIRLCAYLDKIECYNTADAVFERVAQFIQPGNNMNAPIGDRMIPWKEIETIMRDRDWATYKGNPRKRLTEYMALKGVHEPAGYSADGGTSNLKPMKTKYKKNKLIKILTNMLAFEMPESERQKIIEQIKKLKRGDKDAEYLMGSLFDQHGPDEVPGPRNAIIDHASPSMVGLEGFEWNNRRHEGINDYKNLLPL